MILVAEVMLQQTQTARVEIKLPEFLGRFPDAAALAEASRGDVIRAWQGMGYNSRALRLQQTARAVLERHGGRFPESPDQLAALPGVGPYTASAIACFAFGRHVPVMDVNVARVLSRIFHKCHTPAIVLAERTLMPLAAAVIPEGDAYRWNQALMDLGATVCTARAPACDRCPVADVCLSAYPLRVELFNPKDAGRPEPEIRGEPRRLWRGRVVEYLRGLDGAVRVSEVYARLFPPQPNRDHDGPERREMLALVAGLIRDGLVVRPGAVHEGGVADDDTIALPA